MHYSNGREAKVGDRIFAYNNEMGIFFSGVVTELLPDTDTCNIRAVKVEYEHFITSKDCIHAEDAVKLGD